MKENYFEKNTCRKKDKIKNEKKLFQQETSKMEVKFFFLTN